MHAVTYASQDSALTVLQASNAFCAVPTLTAHTASLGGKLQTQQGTSRSLVPYNAEVSMDITQQCTLLSNHYLATEQTVTPTHQHMMTDASETEAS